MSTSWTAGDPPDHGHVASSRAVTVASRCMADLMVDWRGGGEARVMTGSLKQLVLIWAMVFGLFAVVNVMSAEEPNPQPTFAEFLVDLERGDVHEVVMRTRDNSVRVERARGETYTVGYPNEYASVLVEQLRATETPFDIEPGGSGLGGMLLRVLLPVALLVGFALLVLRRSRRGGGRYGSFGRAPARQPAADGPTTSFSDVAGADEAVEELREITDFLARPARFKAIGARIPKGVLLYGPPGTGKTLLARAVAGEAGVPFFSISGSDFVEMFVGVGASRVRDLFEQAKAQAPAILFVDEIDAVGRHRGAGVGGGHDEREQTLNQLLVEMDGFEPTDHVIVIAATNRPDILDPALLRPGRFDRQIAVDRPGSRRPPQDPRGPHARQAGRRRRGSRRRRRPDGRTDGRRSRQPGQRGRAAGGPHGHEGDHSGRARRGHHAGGCGT